MIFFHSRMKLEIETLKVGCGDFLAKFISWHLSALIRIPPLSKYLLEKMAMVGFMYSLFLMECISACMYRKDRNGSEYEKYFFLYKKL